MYEIMSLLKKGTHRQLFAATIGSISAVCAASSYFWVTPLIPLLNSRLSPIVATKDQLSWLVAIIEIGDFFGTLPVGLLADRFGRRKILLLISPFLALTWVWVLFSSSIYVLLICRFLQGFVVGSIFTVLPLYLGEVSSPSTRGFVGNLVQVMWYVGNIFINTFGPMTSYQGVTIICLVPPLVFMCLLFFCPETPNYYQIRGKTEKAQKIEDWLKGTVSAEASLNAAKKEQPTKSKTSWYHIFFQPKSRKALAIVHIIAFTNVIGVPAILSYCNEIFSRTTSDYNHYSVIMGVLTLLVSLISGALVNRVGKKPLLIISTLLSAAILFCGSAIYYLQEFHKVKSIIYSDLGIWLTVFYPVAMSLGPGSLTYSIQAELFLNEHRGTACSILTLSVASFTFVSLKMYKVIEDIFGLFMVYLTLGIISLIGVVIMYFYVPETKGKTFEEIQELL